MYEYVVARVARREHHAAPVCGTVYHSACSRLIRNISKIQSQLKNDTSRTKGSESAVNPGHSQQESKVGPRPHFLISRFAWI
eukprot:COSAG01_NODE_1379_length_10522_cov_25.951454_1_plen_81_part_10